MTEKQGLMKQNMEEENKLFSSISQINNEIALNDSEFETVQDYYEARKELKKEKKRNG